ncbi:MAG: hypothetical protein M5U12_32820 [Verrucomicrobia bacterium]|nr:hypothetical protein [Verrucomicrobiota bacterium]
MLWKERTGRTLPELGTEWRDARAGRIRDREAGRTRDVTRDFLLDRIHGGWAGMLIGGLEGLPHEFKYGDRPRDALSESTFLENGARSDDDNDVEWTHLWYMDRERVPRPILIGEFHIGAPDRGLSSGLVQAMNQAERGVAYRYYVEQCAAHPALVGTHWFQWLDQPATGRNDGENYNIGFVDVTDQPYAELVAAAKATHRRLLDVHAGRVPPFSQKPRASEAGAP